MSNQAFTNFELETMKTVLLTPSKHGVKIKDIRLIKKMEKDLDKFIEPRPEAPKPPKQPVEPKEPKALEGEVNEEQKKKYEEEVKDFESKYEKYLEDKKTFQEEIKAFNNAQQEWNKSMEDRADREVSVKIDNLSLGLIKNRLSTFDQFRQDPWVQDRILKLADKLNIQ